MKHKPQSLIIGLSLSLTLGLGAIASAPIALAAEPSGSVIAQDTRSLVQLSTSAPSTITVKSNPGAPVKAKMVGSKKVISKKADNAGFATFAKLTAGSPYTFTTNGESAIGIPVTPVTPASNLTVSTTESPDSVHLAWKHQTVKPQGYVSYRVTAGPVDAQGNVQSAQTITNTVTGLETTLIGLDTSQRYEFAVIPFNSLGDGQATVALMTRSLGEITGVSQKAEVREQIPPAPQAPKAAATPAPAPAGPSTKTIYVCPDGFSDNGGLCTKSLPYTFTTRDYTFHSESRIESCSGADCPGSTYVVVPTPCNVGTAHGDTCQYWSTGQRNVTVQVKDSAPSGYADNGSAWVQKDALPAGYSDNGSEWISTAAKITRVVPA